MLSKLVLVLLHHVHLLLIKLLLSLHFHLLLCIHWHHWHELLLGMHLSTPWVVRRYLWHHLRHLRRTWLSLHLLLLIWHLIERWYLHMHLLLVTLTERRKLRVLVWLNSILLLHLLLLHHCSLLLSKLHILLLHQSLLMLFVSYHILFLNKLEKLLFAHWKNLVESTKHKSFEEFIRNAKDWWSMWLGIAMKHMICATLRRSLRVRLRLLHTTQKVWLL